MCFYFLFVVFSVVGFLGFCLGFVCFLFFVFLFFVLLVYFFVLF